MLNKALLSTCLLVSLTGTGSVYASPEPLGSGDVYVNGQQLSRVEIRRLEHDIGTRIAPGHYLYDSASGCWHNQTNGTSGCLSGDGSYGSRYGSGYHNAQSWNHWSNAAGGGVGGTADGCVYTTFGWSNC